MPFSADELRELPHVISGPRFGTYLQAMGGDRSRALELYVWNLELSSAFMVPLQICEVAVRNGVAEAIEKAHTPTWPWNKGFINSLPQPKLASQYNPQVNLRDVASKNPTVGKIIAELNFAFWERTFTRGQDARLWLPHFRASFPGCPAAISVPFARATAYDNLWNVRQLRNRIAHHEPIFTRNLADDHRRLRELIEWRNPTAATWLDTVERVTGLLATRP